MLVHFRLSALLRARHAAPICGLVSVALFVAAAHSAETVETLPPGGHAGGAFIAAWDNDGDGKVSRTEYETVRVERFAATDRNRDGSLNVDEYLNEYVVRLDRQIADERDASMKQTNTRFRSIDKDADQVISRTEYDSSGERAFTHLDQDKDGRITTQDAEPKRENAAPVSRRSVISMPTSHTRAGMLEIYDDDGDDVLTREQYNAQRARAFAATDLNKDGKLDETEYTKEFAARLSHRIDERREDQLKQGRVRFKAIDDDKNGGISRDEYFAMSARMFDRTDTNKDGLVSQDDPPPVRKPREDERPMTSQAQSP